MVLLGVRTAWRVELEASPAELTFGTSLHLPGEFVETSGKKYGEHELLSNLQEQMRELRPVQTSNHATSRRNHVPNTLEKATHVFVRRDAKAPPLTRPYTGPFKVTKKAEKYFEISMNGKIDKVSIDRLKPAWLEKEEFVCYDPRAGEKLSEKTQSIPTQPLQRTKKRGRPTRAELEDRRRAAEVENRQRRIENREQEFLTRSGRLSRLPDRL